MTDTTAAASELYRLVVAHWKEDPRTIHGPLGYLVGGLEPDDALRLCAELNRLAAQGEATASDLLRWIETHPHPASWVATAKDIREIVERMGPSALAAQPSASFETLIAEARAKLPDAGPEAIARHLYTYLAASPDMSNALWLIQGLKDVIGRERAEQSRIMGDFKDAAPGAAAEAAHDSFLRANPHLNESDPNVRA